MQLSSDISPTLSLRRKLWRCSRKRRRPSPSVKRMLAKWGKLDFTAIAVILRSDFILKIN